MATPAPPAPLTEQLPPASPKQGEDPALQRLQSEMNKLREQTNRTLQQFQQPAPSNPQPPPDKKSLEKEFYTDPIRHSADIAATVAQGITNRAMQEMGGTFETLREVAKSQVRSEDPELYDKYSMEVETQVASMAPQYHTNINVWKSAFNVVKGNHLRDILAEQQQNGNKSPAIHLSQDSGPSQVQNRPPAASQKPKLTDEEKQWARNLKVSEEAYQQGKEDLENQNVRGKSSWDQYVTFDSQDVRRRKREQRNNKSK
jgi:hypothetical protein